MRRYLRTAAAATAALLLAGCATMSVSSHVQRDLDFSGYRTFDWGPADELPTGDPRLDNDPFFKDHMMGAVEREMAARGFARAAASGSPDLLIHYHANITERMHVNEVDVERGYCTEDDCWSSELAYEAGTLVLDLVDARTNKVIWRGWAQSNVEGALESQDTMERQINEAVSRMLAQLPRPL